jgi:hypothetical protein
MGLSKPIGIHEGISLDKSIKSCYMDYTNGKFEVPVVYSVIFLDRIDLDLYVLIRFDLKKGSLSYGLKYIEGD